MKLSVKDILIFCIDRALRQFHLNYNWFITGDAGEIYDSVKQSIKSKSEDFFEQYNYFIAFRVPEMTNKQQESENIAKISKLITTALTGGQYLTNTSFVQVGAKSLVMVGLKIE